MLNLDLREDILIRKLLGRRICPKCHSAYNIENVDTDGYVMPPMLPKKKESMCDTCDVDLIKRDDDTEEVITHRLHIYKDQVKDILAFYE
jgi:adenylate kinase